MTKPLISLCMICKNEEKMIGRCLSSVQGLVDEIIVVDTGSTDDTISIVETFQAQVIQMEWEHDFAKARNKGLQQASGKWILCLDADEELDPSGIEAIRQFAETSSNPACYFNLLNYHGKSEITKTMPNDSVPVLRFFRNHPEVRFEGKVHEQIGGSIRTIFPSQRIPNLSSQIFHYGYLEDTVVEKNKKQRNLSLLLQQLEDEPTNPFHHYNIGGEFMRLKEYEKALSHFHQSKSLCDIRRYGFGHLTSKKQIMCLERLGRYKEALQVCQEDIKLFPDFPDLYFLMGQFATVLGEIDVAIEVYQQAMLKKDIPAHYAVDRAIPTIKAPFQLAILYEKNQQYDQALSVYKGIIENQHLRYLPAFTRMIRLLKMQQKEMFITPILRKILPQNNREQVSLYLYHMGCYQAALDFCGANSTLVDRLEVILGRDDTKQSYFREVKDTWKGKPTTSKEQFITFLQTGEWEDSYTPSQRDWDSIYFCFHLYRNVMDSAKLSSVFRLWKYLLSTLTGDNKVRAQMEYAMYVAQYGKELLVKGERADLWSVVTKEIPDPIPLYWSVENE